MSKVRKSRGQKIIANMGLFWHQDQVRWRGDVGFGRARLAGKRRSAKKKGEVDFWKQTGIYALYADYHLVYVGQAGLTDKSCIGRRLKDHLTDSLAGRWDMFSWFGLQPVTKQNTLEPRRALTQTRKSHLANVLEGIVIEIAEPPLNSQKGRFGKRVERFIQVDDSLIPGTKEQKRMQKQIDSLATNLKKAKKQILTAVRKAAQ